MIRYSSAVEAGGSREGAEAEGARADLENDTEKSRSNVKKELNLDDCEEQEIKEGLNTRV